MDNFYAPFIYSWDGQSNCRFRYSILSLDEKNYYDDQELNIAIVYQFLPSPGENPIPDSIPDFCSDISQWELQITGKPSNGDFRGELNRRLASEGVSLAIRNEVIPFVYDKVASYEAVSARVVIEILIEEDEDEDEEEDIIRRLLFEDDYGDGDEDEYDQLEIDEEFDVVMDRSMEEDYSKALSASREVVEALEKVMIRGEERETSCAVCLEEFELGFEAARMPCSHVFHGDCIGSWLVNRCVCPLCRYEVSYVEEAN